MDYVKDGELLKTLGHPVRLKIITGLMDKKECNVSAMVKKLKIPQSTASQHLGLLKARGVIECRKKGVESCYYIIDERVRKIMESL